MDIEYAILYTKCDNDPSNQYQIKLVTQSAEQWSEGKIKTIPMDPNKIILVLVGPRTVMEYYSGPNFTGTKTTIANPSNTKDIVKKLNCTSLKKYYGSLRSFILMTYDYYDRQFKTAYCRSDRDCKQFELCMCPDGKTHPSHCPLAKRRCMSNYYFATEGPIQMRPNDQVEPNCLGEELANYKQNQISYDLLNWTGTKCQSKAERIAREQCKNNFGMKKHLNNNISLDCSPLQCHQEVEPFSQKYEKYREEPFIITSIILLIIIFLLISCKIVI